MAENPFKKAIASRTEPDVEDPEVIQPEPLKPKAKAKTKTKPKATPVKPVIEPVAQPVVEKRGRGRPATGKRSDDAWIGRTFYVKRETDLDVEMELLKLKRQGIDIDKSELVDLLLFAWVKWQQGENLEIHLSEISPM